MFFRGFGQSIGAGSQISRAINAFSVAVLEDVHPAKVGTALVSTQPPFGSRQLRVEGFSFGIALEPRKFGVGRIAHGLTVTVTVNRHIRQKLNAHLKADAGAEGNRAPAINIDSQPENVPDPNFPRRSAVPGAR